MLNDMAYRRGPECHTEVEWLERRLQGLNYGQGLGISMWSVVIVRKKLAMIATAISGGAVTVVTAARAERGHGGERRRHHSLRALGRARRAHPGLRAERQLLAQRHHQRGAAQVKRK